MANKQNKNTWIKPRHRRYWNFANCVLKPVIDHKYNMEIVPFDDANGQYLVLCNHQTPFDQFFMSRLFTGKIYFVCTEDLLSNKTVGKLIKHCIEPIPIQKGALDIGTIKACAKVAKEGGTIVVYPEGNRTYSGKTGYVKPTIAKLAKFLKLPIAIVSQQGGYSIQPRWSDNIRKGKGSIAVKNVLPYDNYKDMSDQQLYDYICQQLQVDDSLDNGIYKSKRPAEYIERAMYVCPHCGLTTFVSNKDTFYCTKCKTTIKYGLNKVFIPVKGQFFFKTMGEWYDYQCDFINNLSLDIPQDTPLYRDKVTLREVIVGKRKKTICKKINLTMYANRIEFVAKNRKYEFCYDDITAMAVLGRNKLNFHHSGKIYQVKGAKRYNALKYMNIYYRYKNIKENNNGTFLGI